MTAGESVFQGREGTGEAQIYGVPSNPINALMQVNRNKAVRAAADQAAKKRRDDQLAEMAEWNPDARWEPFDDQVRNMSGKLLEWETAQLERGVDPSNAQFRKSRRLFQDQINNLAARSNFMKKQYDNARNVYAKDKKGFFDVGYYDQRLNDVFMDANGNGRDIATIDINSANKILDDAGGYNIGAIAQDFVSDLPQKLMQDYQEQANNLGLTYDIDTFRSKLFRTDGDGRIQYDPETNLPMLNLTPEVVRGAMGNTLIRNYVDQRMEENPGETKDEILKEILTPYDELEQERNIKIGHKRDLLGKGAGFNNRPRATNRYQTVRRAIFQQDKSALANAVNNIDGVELDFVNNETGVWNPDEQPEPDKIRVTMRSKKLDPAGNPVEPTVEFINIRTQDEKEEAMRRLNILIDDNQGGTGMRVGTDDFELADEEWKRKNQKDYSFTKEKDFGF